MANSSGSGPSRMNLVALQQTDRFIVEIVAQASHAFLYSYKLKTQEWEKSDIEGTLFLCRRTQAPYYGFIVLNRLGLKNFVQEITRSLEFDKKGPLLIYNNPDLDVIRGLWFYSEKECENIYDTILGLDREKGMTNHAGGVTPPVNVPSTSARGGPTPPVDIMSLLAKAHSQFEEKEGVVVPPTAPGAKSNGGTPSKGAPPVTQAALPPHPGPAVSSPGGGTGGTPTPEGGAAEARGRKARGGNRKGGGAQHQSPSAGATRATAPSAGVSQPSQVLSLQQLFTKAKAKLEASGSPTRTQASSGSPTRTQAHRTQQAPAPSVQIMKRQASMPGRTLSELERQQLGRASSGAPPSDPPVGTVPEGEATTSADPHQQQAKGSRKPPKGGAAPATKGSEPAQQPPQEPASPTTAIKRSLNMVPNIGSYAPRPDKMATPVGVGRGGTGLGPSGPSSYEGHAALPLSSSFPQLKGMHFPAMTRGHRAERDDQALASLSTTLETSLLTDSGEDEANMADDMELLHAPHATPIRGQGQGAPGRGGQQTGASGGAQRVGASCSGTGGGTPSDPVLVTPGSLVATTPKGKGFTPKTELLTPMAFEGTSHHSASAHKRTPFSGTDGPDSTAQGAQIHSLTKEQFKQAFVHLLDSDDQFLSALHGAYSDSLNASLAKRF